MLSPEPFFSEALPYLAELRGVARRFAGARPDVADDLVQDTLLKAFAARDRYQPGTNARAWLHTILWNAARSRFRRERRDRRLEERYAREPNVRAQAEEPHASLDRGDARLTRALHALPPAYRAVVEQVDLEGRSYREVAEQLAVPIGTVMSRLHRGRRRLRQALGGLTA